MKPSEPSKGFIWRLFIGSLTSDPEDVGWCDCRATEDVAKANACGEGVVESTRRNHRVQAAARGEGIGRVNWGPSAAGELVSQPDGIMHKPEGGRQRRRCGCSKQRSGWTTQPAGEPRATRLAVQVRSLWGRLVARPITDPTLRTEIRTVTAYKRGGAGEGGRGVKRV